MPRDPYPETGKIASWSVLNADRPISWVASDYLQVLRDYVEEHGSLPPVEYDKQLSNWLQWSRAEARANRLPMATAQALLELGIDLGYKQRNAANAPLLEASIDFAYDFIEAGGQDLVDIEDKELSKLLKSQLGADWYTWFVSLVETAFRDTQAQRLLAVEEVCPELARLALDRASRRPRCPESFERRPRGMMNVLAAIETWVLGRGRPALTSGNPTERYLALWLYRIENRNQLESMCGAAPSRLLRNATFAQPQAIARVRRLGTLGKFSEHEVATLRRAALAVRARGEIGTRWFNLLYRFELPRACSDMQIGPLRVLK